LKKHAFRNAIEQAEKEYLEQVEKKPAAHSLTSIEVAKWVAERRIGEEFGTRSKVTVQGGHRPVRVVIKKY